MAGPTWRRATPQAPCPGRSQGVRWRKRAKEDFFGRQTTRYGGLDANAFPPVAPGSPPACQGESTRRGVGNGGNFPWEGRKKLDRCRSRLDRMKEAASTTFCVDSARGNDILGPTTVGDVLAGDRIQGFSGGKMCPRRPGNPGSSSGRSAGCGRSIKDNQCSGSAAREAFLIPLN